MAKIQIDNAKDRLDEHDPKAAHVIIRTFKAFTIRNRTGLRSKNGKLANDNYEISKIFENQN